MSEKERTIFEFIKKNEGTSKENIVRYFFNEYSRVTIFKIITSLEKKGFIHIKENESNRQTRCIIVNHENIVLKVSEEVEEFRNSLFQVLDNVDKHLKITMRETEIGNQSISKSLREIYEGFISIYYFRAMLQWSQNISDKQTLFHLYTVVMKNTIEIQKRISNYISGLVPAIPYNVEICNDDDYDDQILPFSKIDMKDSIRPLIDSLIRINSTYKKERF